jgi:hypothetical protein
MLRFLKTSRYTMLVALSALILSIGGLAFSVADAYASRTTVLAKALQSVGLCPIPSKTEGVPAPTVTVTATPTPSVSASPTPSAKPTINSEPTPTPVKGASGANGSTGNTGATGATGEKGDKGDTGATGSSGSTGPQGPAGICDLSNILSVNGDLVPGIDNTYSLGTITKRWKSLQLGPGTLWIQDSEVTPPTQVGLTVKSGALLLDGADSLRIGNMRLTATGLTSINPASPLTLGDNTFNSFVQLQALGLKFKDGTTQSTATVSGPTGPTGPQGPQGPQGEPGRDGNIEGFIEVPACVIEDSKIYAKLTIVYAKCGEIEGKGRDIIILERKQ